MEAGEGTQKDKSAIWTRFPVLFITAFICCALWGSASPVIKIAYRLFQIGPEDTASRIMLAGSRFIIAGLMTIFFGSILARRWLTPKKTSWAKIGVLALVQTALQYYFFFMALANISGVRGSIINAFGNFIAILFASMIFRFEKMTLKKIMGSVVGLIGIIVIMGGWRALVSGGGLTLAGEGAMLAADLLYAVSAGLIKIYSRNENPVTLSGYQFLLGGAVLFAIGLLTGGELCFYTPSCWMNLVYLGLISAGAYTLWGVLLKHNPVSRVSILGFMNPVMGVLLSALLLGEGSEAFALKSLIAILLVSAGIIIVNSRDPGTGS